MKDAPSEVHERLGNARSILGEIIDEDLRSITRHLYPTIIRIGLPSALESLADRFRCMLAVDIDMDWRMTEVENSVSSGLDIDLRLTLYRIVEEALTNVVKHAGADRVRIHLGFSSDAEVYVTVHDNGRGFDAEQVKPGNGLLCMEDYAEALSGRLDVDSTPGMGSTISVHIPVSDRIRPLAQV